MEYLTYFAKLFILICLVSEAIQDGNVSEPVVIGSFVKVPTPRILWGHVAASGQFPYQVSVRVGGKHSCGGAIMSQNYVITAARCVYSLIPSFLTVQAGSVHRTSGGVILNVAKVIPHPAFNYYDSDIALLKLYQLLEFNDLIQPIPIATISPPAYAAVTISGWGRTREAGPLTEQLIYNRNSITLKDDRCATEIGFNSSKILCLGKTSGYGICEGDEGGPAVFRGILVGIASFHTNGCGTTSPDGFTKVSSFSEWLSITSAIN